MPKRWNGHLIKRIVTIGDFICINIVFSLSYLIFSPELTASFNQKIVWLILNISYIPVNLMFGEIHNERVVYIDELLIKTTKSVLLYFLIFLSLAMFLQLELSKKVLAFYFLGLFATLNIWWFISNRALRFYRKKGYNFKRIVIVGAGKTGMMLFRELQSNAGYGYKFMGFFDDNPNLDPEASQYLLGKTSDVEAFCVANSVDELFCALPGSQDNKIINLLQLSERNTIRFFIVPEVRRFVSRRLNYQMLGAIPLLSVRDEPLQSWISRLVKRTTDIIVSGIVLILSPLWYLPIALAVKISSPGPIFFRQKRTGFLGKDFECLKFRTMKLNRESDLQQAVKGDRRITKVGSFLRKTSLDEFPQFINIFRGDMSVVGPRPHMLKHTEDYSKIIDKYMVRHFIKPGLTGWAQVNGCRGETKTISQMEKRVKYDVWYIEHWNFFLDMKIIMLTVWNTIIGD
ncbi:MAG: undecaprenyl-phosphate glucose phosphotransferase, partial [Bacteroidales bacterium]